MQCNISHFDILLNPFQISPCGCVHIVTYQNEHPIIEYTCFQYFGNLGTNNLVVFLVLFISLLVDSMVCSHISWWIGWYLHLKRDQVTKESIIMLLFLLMRISNSINKYVIRSIRVNTSQICIIYLYLDMFHNA